MGIMASKTALATLIGDVVSSRTHVDREALQRTVAETLHWANAHLGPEQRLELTVGDEFQGGFKTIAHAARASLIIRLRLATQSGGPDSRYGLGYGEVEIFDDQRSPVSQDGPGWWTAREAIDKVKGLARAPRTSFVRTAFWAESDTRLSVDAGAIDAFLLCRDALVDRMDDRARRLLLGVFLRRSQADLAEEEGITQGAVSQNLRRNGAFAIEAAEQELMRIRP
jgi:hypothetical protein